MNCPKLARLAALAWPGSDLAEMGEQQALREHVQRCPECARISANLEQYLNRLRSAHDQLGASHAAERHRLLMMLPRLNADRQFVKKDLLHLRKTEVPMTRLLWAASAAVLFILVSLFLGWDFFSPTSALAQTAKALSEVRSYRCRSTEVGNAKETSFICWAAPGSYRYETYQKDELVEVSIRFKDRPGLEICPRDEIYSRLEPLRGSVSPLELLMELTRFSGQADREMPERTIGKVAARGFEISLTKIEPDGYEGTMRVWYDPTNKLPMRVEMEMTSVGTMIFDEFTWNVPTTRWFDTEPPAKYDDKTPTVLSVEELTEHVVHGLKIYAKYCGHYPPVKRVFGDVQSTKLFHAAGLNDFREGTTLQEIGTETYRECNEAMRGLGFIYHIQSYNSDAAYYGKTVRAQDVDKILLRWKLEDGDYRVIFGDLRVQTVQAMKLKELEASAAKN